MKIAGEMQIDILHGDHLGIAAAGGAALDAEHRPQRRLPQGHDGILPDAAQAIGQTDGGGGLAFAGGGGRDGGHQHQLPVLPVGAQQRGVDLGLIFSVLLQIFLRHMSPRSNGGDGLHGTFLSNLDICLILHE